jgi:fibronectin-binding autotransporter adhesin
MRLQSRFGIVFVAAALGLVIPATPAVAQTWQITTSTTFSNVSAINRLIVGSSSAPGPTLTINAGTTLSGATGGGTGPGFTVGTDSQPYAAVIQNSGQVLVNPWDGISGNGQLYMGLNGTSASTFYTGTATYTLNGGTIILGSTNNSTNANLLLIGRSGGNNTFTQNGGRVTAYRTTANGYQVLAIGSGGQGTYSLTGGTFEGIGVATGSAAGLNLGGGSSGTLTINGAGAAMALEQSNALLAGGTAAVTVNLLNGTLALNGNVTRGNPFAAAYTPGAVSFTLGGGTLRPYSTNLVVGSSTAANTAAFDITLAPSSLSTITGVGWKSGTSTVTIASPIVGSGSIQFTGGTVSLTAANTYSGATTITGTNTTLALGANGTLASSPTIRVGNAGSSGAVLNLTAKTGTFSFTSSQTLGGIGTINIGSGKTVSSAGIWAPGNSIGSNAVTGNLSLSGTSQFELGTPGTSASAPGLSDFTAVSGTLTLGGALDLIDNAGANGNGSAAGGVYRLFTYGSAVSGSYASVTANPTATTRTSLGNISYGGSGTAAGQGVFLSIYNLAAANVVSSTTVNFGTVLKGTSLSQAVSISNTAPAGSFSEGLGAAFGSATGQAGGSGSWSLLSAGGTSTALSVTLASGSAGAASGAQTLNFTSDGAGTSGLGAVGIGSQTVSLAATILDPAVASFASGSAATSLLLDFGSVNEGDTVSPLGFDLYNLMQTAGYTADLTLESITPAGGNTAALTTTLATFNTLASGTFNSWQALVNTSSQGTFSNTWTLQFRSSNGGTVYANDTPQSLTLTTSVIVVPEPGAIALAGIGIAAALLVYRRRR